jgi:hypothetical protein
MIYIAHRGNITGPSSEENKIAYLEHAYNQGFGIEVDVQEYNGKLYFGHDEPQELFKYELVNKPNVFVHLKDIKSAEILGSDNKLNMFSHDTDAYVFTSHGFIWGLHKVLIPGPKSVFLDFETPHVDININVPIYGHCGDYYAR